MSTTRKKNIAIVVATLSHTAETNFHLGVKSALPADQFNIIYLSVGWLSRKNQSLNHVRNIHKILNFEDLDGIVIYGASVANRVPPERVKIITDCYPDIPIVNVGNVVEGLSSVIFDNRQPFRDIVNHLIKDKKATSIAFLAGPIDNFDAQERLESVKETLTLQGMKLDESLILQGDFNISSGGVAMKKFLDRQQPLPNAIVCVNDLSAIGVINELSEFGIRVPEDILVSGFDDLDYSIVNSVPLTTGKYPIFGMGRLAGEKLKNAVVNGVALEEKYLLQTDVIFRRSTADIEKNTARIEQTETMPERFFSRDSNSARLNVSRLIFRNKSIIKNLQDSSTALHDVGIRFTYIFEFDENQKKMSNIYSIFGETVTTLKASHPYFHSLNIQGFFDLHNSGNFNWVFSPILSENHTFGFILVAVLPEEADFAEFLANEIAKNLDRKLLNKNTEFLKKKVLNAEKMASLGRLVSGIAHEINTPLGISLMATTNLNDEMLKIRKMLDDEAMTLTAFNSFLDVCDETYRILFSSIQRSVDLVASFKNVSVDRHRDDIDEFDLSDYISDILASLKPKINASKVLIKNEVEPDIFIKSYPGSWSQIITNLILNSIYHGFDHGSAEGEIEIGLSKDNQDVKLIVSDNGIGIDPEYLSEIFEPFYTTTRGKGGTGLGLHIVFNMVHQKLNGTIDVTSDQNPGANRGTCFTIVVPTNI